MPHDPSDALPPRQESSSAEEEERSTEGEGGASAYRPSDALRRAVGALRAMLTARDKGREPTSGEPAPPPTPDDTDDET